MDDTELKGLGLMVGAGILTGIMFNIGIIKDPFNMGGILGGLVTGILMYIFS
ncbi:MAG: hypothetical protein L6243_04860 [Candidatus Altiarchaeales archaeon]|nr:hypothetical protein [Candidatus Altiarchaeota archaeon]MCG2782900.1 hypothetical protein [Candidatus Altiarchaeales archaeon]MBU4267179.1 hypothetical protein [Candidatus Altiarchaeota archaeon]MBU4342221.1 hypothetical protein [Candidatus Altiarchaeota archaeon]MBU4406011.1 hypothetical protein [Candidatus Altiarchaeota archaeon]